MTLGSGLFLVSLWSVSDVENYEPSLVVTAGEIPDVSAKSFLITDLESGTEIVSKKPTEKLPIASITKLFTAAAFRERTNLVGTTTVTWGDVLTEGRSGKLSAGEVYTYNELVQAMIIESSNDAASTIARSDSGVLDEMNENSKKIGLLNTVFADTSGLSDKDISTAYELAKLTKAVWITQPHIFDVANMEQIIGTYTGWINNNPFIHMQGYKGGKHGFTNEAKYTAVAVFEEDLPDIKNDFLYIILGSNDLVSDIEQLRQYVDKHVIYE